MHEIFAACDASYLDIPLIEISYILLFKKKVIYKKLKGSANAPLMLMLMPMQNCTLMI